MLADLSFLLQSASLIACLLHILSSLHAEVAVSAFHYFDPKTNHPSHHALSVSQQGNLYGLLPVMLLESYVTLLTQGLCGHRQQQDGSGRQVVALQLLSGGVNAYLISVAAGRAACSDSLLTSQVNKRIKTCHILLHCNICQNVSMACESASLKDVADLLSG